MAERTSARKPAGTTAIRCEARVQVTGGSTILRLPDDASAELPSRGQVSVNAVLNGHAFQAVLEPDGRRGHWLRVDQELRQALALGAGDTVSLSVEPANDWPEPDIPGDFQAALAGASDISELWKSLTPMARWEWVRWINATKNLQTRERRVEAGISKLRSGKRRPCCFDLASCTDPDLSKNGMLADVILGVLVGCLRGDGCMERKARFDASQGPRIVHPGDGLFVDLGGCAARMMIWGEESGGGFALVEHPIPPRHLAAPVHRHHDEDEYSFVLEGTLGALLGDEVVFAQAGDLAFKPRDQWHTFWNAGDTPCRILEIISPGGFEHYFAEVAGAAESPATLSARYRNDVDVERTRRLCEDLGLTFPPMPPSR